MVLNQTNIVYIITVVLASLFAGMAQKLAKDKQGKYKLNYFFWVASMVVLIVIMGYRTIGVGIDDLTYNRIFNNVREIRPNTAFLKYNNGTRIFDIKLCSWAIYR